MLHMTRNASLIVTTASARTKTLAALTIAENMLGSITTVNVKVSHHGVLAGHGTHSYNEFVSYNLKLKAGLSVSKSMSA